MAGRTSASVGIVVTLTVLGVLSLGLFILTVVFFGKYNNLKSEFTTLTRDTDQYIKGSERQDDTVRTIVDQAKKSGGMSAVGYLSKSLQDTMQAVSGNKRDSFATLAEKLKAIPGADANSVLGVVAAQSQELSNLSARVKAAEAERVRALADLQSEVDRVQGIQKTHEGTVANLTSQVAAFQKEVETYREGTNKAREDMEARISQVKTDAETKESELLGRIAKLQEESIIQQGIITDLRGKNKDSVVSGQAEFALVDGQVIGVNPAGSTCTISIGRKNKLRLGMTFAVYPDGNSIKADKRTGEYLPGKATIEVINVGEASSTCRVISEVKGNPVLNGDVIANAIYDPNKTYKFLVYGNFDVNGDGVYTPLERNDLQAIIEAWGGKVEKDLAGDLDFLVLGERPVLPPKPSPDSPIEILQEYIRLNKVIELYDDYLKKAQQTGLPVLNENRLNTLIGRTKVGR